VRKLGPWDLRLRKQPKYSTLKRFKCPDQNKMEMQAPLFSFQFWHIYTHSKMDQRPDTSQLLISFQVNASVSWMLRWLIDRLIIRGWVYTQPERRCTQAMNALSSRLLLVRVRLSLSCPPGRQAGTIPTTSITDHVSKRKKRPSSSGSGGCTTEDIRTHGPLYSSSIRPSQQDSLLYTQFSRTHPSSISSSIHSIHCGDPLITLSKYIHVWSSFEGFIKTNLMMQSKFNLNFWFVSYSIFSLCLASGARHCPI
jgi:hypothetical protein